MVGSYAWACTKTKVRSGATPGPARNGQERPPGLLGLLRVRDLPGPAPGIWPAPGLRLVSGLRLVCAWSAPGLRLVCAWSAPQKQRVGSTQRFSGRSHGGWPIPPEPHRTASGTHPSPGGTLCKGSAMGYRCCYRHGAHGLPSAGTNFRRGSALSKVSRWEANAQGRTTNQPYIYSMQTIIVWFFFEILLEGFF